MNKELFLCIETSAPISSIGVGTSDEFQWVLEPTSDGSKRRDPILALEEFFETSDRSLDEIGAVLVSQGPGAYTGLRVGLSCAQGIAFTRTIPLITFSSTKLVAEAWRQQNLEKQGIVAVFVDARAQMVIGQRFEICGESLRELEPPHCSEPEKFLNDWESHIPLIGSGYTKWQDLCQKHGFKGEEIYSTAQTLVSLHLKNDGTNIAPEDLVPLYARDPVG